MKEDLILLASPWSFSKGRKCVQMNFVDYEDGSHKSPGFHQQGDHENSGAMFFFIENLYHQLIPIKKKKKMVFRWL